MSYKITVVGGGTAGVMAATYFKSYWGDLVDVTMIYDHKKPGIGVGESLTPIFDNYLKTVGITTIELIQNCNATIKLGLKFKNWTHKGSEWHHSFPINEALDATDSTVADYNAIDAYDILHDQYENSYNYDNFYYDNNLIFGTDNLSYRHAMHIDANLVGRYIESKFKDRINIVDGIVQQVNVDNREITSLILASGEVMTSDLFIDASGLEYALIKHLNPEWIDVTDQLPTNRTIPNPLFKDFDYIPPYTTADATKNGWILDVPLSNRRGTGYVYSSEFTSDEEAKKDFNQWLLKTHGTELASDRVIKFNNGYWKEQWIGNCIAVGLASGFVEPLEATSLHNTYSQLDTITSTHSLIKCQIDSDAYNMFSTRMYENSVEYIRFFYHTKRTDSEFWKYLTNNTPNWLQDLDAKLLNAFPGPRDFPKIGMFGATSYTAIGYGHGRFTKEGIERYLNSKHLMQHAKHASAQVKKIKLDLRKHAVDHKQWIDYIKSIQ
jgi:tryptophan halogenase